MPQAKDILPSLSFVSALTESSKDIYDILASLALFALRDSKLMTFDREEAARTVNSCYGFSLPVVIVNSALNRLCEQKLCEKKGKGKFSLLGLGAEEIYTDLKSDLEELNLIYENLVAKIVFFAKEQFNCNILKDDLKKKLYNVILGEHSSDDTVNTILELFLIAHQQDEMLTQSINSIKKGGVIYTGVCSTPNLNSLGSWTKEMHLFLATDVLFSAFGINGEIVEKRTLEFFSLIYEINRSNKLVHLHLFSETQQEIDDYFFVAESLVTQGLKADLTKQGMVDLLKDCTKAEDIIRKKVKFKEMLVSSGITLYPHEIPENMTPYYLSSVELLNEIHEDAVEKRMNFNKDDIGKQFALLEKINAYRKGMSHCRFVDAKFFYVTSKSLTHLIAKKPSFKAKQKDIPLASNVNYLTEKFWFALNKGFSDSKLPASFDMISKAKAAISSKLADSVFSKFGTLKSELGQGNLSDEHARGLYQEYLSRILRAESLEPSVVVDVFHSLSEEDIAQYIEEQSALKAQAQQGSDALKTLTNLYRSDVKEQRVVLKKMYRAKYVRYICLLHSLVIVCFGGTIYLISAHVSDNLLISVFGSIVSACLLSYFSGHFLLKKMTRKLWRNIISDYRKEISCVQREFKDKYSLT